MPPRTRAAKRAADEDDGTAKQAPVKQAAPPAAAPAKRTSARATKATPAKAAAAPASPPSVKKGLQGHAAPASDAPLGVVDPASGAKNAHILNQDGVVYDVMLSLVDLSKNSDKYYLLQVIIDGSGDVFTWARWGRTGTAGQSQIWKAADEDEAVSIFSDKYKEKTGCEWEDHDNFVQQPGKYKLLKTDHVAIANKAPVIWQYYVDDGVDGKADGWYDYDDNASAIVERLHDEWLYNQELGMRLVDSGNWTYQVDMKKMTQTNTTTSRERKIRRMVRNFNGGKNAAGTPASTAPASTAPSRKRTAAAASASAAASSPPMATPPAKRGKTAATATPSSTATKSRVTGANISLEEAAGAAGSGKVDPACPLASTGTVEEDFDVMLNQTDISANKNKFYLAQLVNVDGEYHLWTRWGRVGESGATQLQGPFDFDGGAAEFKKKFKAKTGNDFDNRDNFVPKAGKYEMIALQGIKEEDEEEDVKPAIKVKAEPSSASSACKLDATTRKFVEFIFNGDMFSEAMSQMELDVKRMPLGRLSKTQVQRGIDVLEEIEAEINGSANHQQLQVLSSKFYQVIPHSFGRTKPPVISSIDTVRQKYDLCNVLQDIETAQQMMSAADGGSAVHPADSKYAELKTDMELVDSKSEEYAWINKYLTSTMHKSYNKVKLLDAWRADRHGEGPRFTAHDGMDNRKLLWHGTNVAVVAAILKSGLRIMPHSGGRVGSGIYMASESGKSIWYVRGANNQDRKHVGIMFLVEAALGKQHSITKDDWTIKAPPAGFDSVVARGQQEPDPKDDMELEIDGHKVIVPQGKPVPQPQYKNSSFDQTEYLIYKESQHRIRYVLTVQM